MMISNKKEKINSNIEKEHYDEVIYPDWKKNHQPKILDFLSNVGMVYEQMEKALPGSVNGFPIFGSCGFLSKKDSKRFIDTYERYEKARKELDEIY